MNITVTNDDFHVHFVSFLCWIDLLERSKTITLFICCIFGQLHVCMDGRSTTLDLTDWNVYRMEIHVGGPQRMNPTDPPAFSSTPQKLNFFAFWWNVSATIRWHSCSQEDDCQLLWWSVDASSGTIYDQRPAKLLPFPSAELCEEC